jgi:hypothetical protein
VEGGGEASRSLDTPEDPARKLARRDFSKDVTHLPPKRNDSRHRVRNNAQKCDDDPVTPVAFESLAGDAFDRAFLGPIQPREPSQVERAAKNIDLPHSGKPGRQLDHHASKLCVPPEQLDCIGQRACRWRKRNSLALVRLASQCLARFAAP